MNGQNLIFFILVIFRLVIIRLIYFKERKLITQQIWSQKAVPLRENDKVEQNSQIKKFAISVDYMQRAGPKISSQNIIM